MVACATFAHYESCYSKDILSRWTFPLVPDDNHPDEYVYEHLRGNKYMPKDNSVILSRTCKVGNNTLIGPSTQVFAGARITTSILGASCSIGVNSVIANSYLFDGVVVGANCYVESSIIGAGVEIGEGSRIAKGSLVADGVRLGPAARLVPFERVSKREGGIQGEDGEDADDEEEESDDDSEIEEAREGVFYLYLSISSFLESPNLSLIPSPDQTLLAANLGKNSNGFVWPRKSARGESEDVDGVESFNSQRLIRLGKSTCPPCSYVTVAECISS